MIWTEQDKDTLRDLARDGMNSREIGEQLLRTPGAIRAMASDLGIKINETGKRSNKQTQAEAQELAELRLKSEIAWEVGGAPVHKIEIPPPSFGSEATAFALASDWHYEETVDPEQVEGYNEFNIEIAEKRSKLFFANTLKLTDMAARDIQIHNLVIALLGDLMSGYIHEELLESNALSPTETIIALKRVITNGLNHILENSDYNLIVPCCFGNHGRTTIKKRISTSYKNSFEWLLYHHLADEFRNHPRVKFHISKGYFFYLPIYGKNIRFHHGDYVKYGGGVGGISIPINKAIAQWDKLKRADLDALGHFHQRMATRKFIANGPLIGYSPFALSIKAEPEPPSQSFFLFDNKHGKTLDCPVFLE